jgi:hypothetical protein
MEGKRPSSTTEPDQISQTLNKSATSKPATKVLKSNLKFLYTHPDCLNNKKMIWKFCSKI